MYISSVPGSPYSAKCAANPTEPRAATICVPVGACLGFWRTRMPTGSLPIIEPGHTLESTLNPACPSALTSCCPTFLHIAPSHCSAKRHRMLGFGYDAFQPSSERRKLLRR
jgi:hypothetical protein